MSVMAVALALAWAVIALLAVVVLALARQVGVLHQRIAPVGALLATQGPSQGEVAPVVRATTLAGTSLEVGRPSGVATLMLFVSPTCPLCKALLTILPNFAATERLDVLLASDDAPDALEVMATRHGLDRARFLNSAELGRTWAVDKLPHAVLLDGDGRIVARGLVNSREHLESMVVAAETGLSSIQHWVRSEAA